jgi:hydroxymethylpyrimidine/phosphomethylpyrimidine kinase
MWGITIPCFDRTAGLTNEKYFTRRRRERRENHGQTCSLARISHAKLANGRQL